MEFRSNTTRTSGGRANIHNEPFYLDCRCQAHGDFVSVLLDTEFSPKELPSLEVVGMVGRKEPGKRVLECFCSGGSSFSYSSSLSAW